MIRLYKCTVYVNSMCILYIMYTLPLMCVYACCVFFIVGLQVMMGLKLNSDPMIQQGNTALNMHLFI